MKLSKFLMYANLPDGSVAIRQTMDGGLMALDVEEVDAFQRGDLTEFDEDEIELMKDQLFIRDDDIDEGKILIHEFEKTWHGGDTFILHLMPTNNCQLGCPYCYEDGICRNSNMNQSVEEQLYPWVHDYIKSRKIKTLRLVWFGGEPLLRAKQIERITPLLADIANRLSVAFETQVVTNGVLLSDQLLKALSAHNLQRLQITLDGPQRVNDRRRFYKNSNRGTFTKIFQNIRMALSGGYIEKVDLRMNIDRANRIYIPELIGFLAEQRLQNQLKLSIGIITGTIPREECGGGANNYFQTFGFSEEEAISAYLEIAAIAKASGFEILDQLAFGPWCIARHPNAWMVGPNGEIYRCLSMVGRDDGILGHLPDVPSNRPNELETINRMHDCLKKECPLVPICGGGCLFENHINGNTCPRNLLTKINQGLIRLNYE